jgi:hypothetical protein
MQSIIEYLDVRLKINLTKYNFRLGLKIIERKIIKSNIKKKEAPFHFSLSKAQKSLVWSLKFQFMHLFGPFYFSFLHFRLKLHLYHVLLPK